jgi:hypothetical protein
MDFDGSESWDSWQVGRMDFPSDIKDAIQI